MHLKNIKTIDYLLFKKKTSGITLLFFKAKGLSIVQDVEKDKSMVQELLDFKGKLDLLITDAFNNNDKFLTLLKVIIWN